MALPFRTGFGFDVHRLVEGRDLWIGGVKIEHSLGLLGHSDADVAIHALCDAMLGAAALRDIGFHIPAMQKAMAECIGCDPDDISVKATTTERLGFTGRQEGISAYATVLIARN